MISVKARAFLASYATVGNITAAARLAGVGRQTHYKWLTNSKYAEAFEVAQAEAIDALETEARRRAVEGTEKPIFYIGRQCGVVREFSDTLLIFLLKAAAPEKYRERSEVKQSGNVNVNQQVEIIEGDWYGTQVRQAITAAGLEVPFGLKSKGERQAAVARIAAAVKTDVESEAADQQSDAGEPEAT